MKYSGKRKLNIRCGKAGVVILVPGGEHLVQGFGQGGMRFLSKDDEKVLDAFWANKFVQRLVDKGELSGDGNDLDKHKKKEKGSKEDSKEVGELKARIAKLESTLEKMIKLSEKPSQSSKPQGQKQGGGKSGAKN